MSVMPFVNGRQHALNILVLQAVNILLHSLFYVILFDYSSCQGAVSTINAKFDQEKNEARREYNLAKSKVEAELQGRLVGIALE